MDSTWVDTSLDLNLNLLNPGSEVPKREFKEDHFAEFEETASVKEKTGVLVEELNRISTENKKLTEMLSVLCENYKNLQKQYMNLMSKNTENEIAISKKRKAADYYSNMIGFNGLSTECSTSDEESCKRPKENNNIKAKVSRVYVRASASNSNLVQRSAEDPSILVATYEGEHNHPQPNSKAELSLSPSHGENASIGNNTIHVSAESSMRSTSPIVTPEMIQSGILFDDAKKSTVEEIEAPAIQKILVQQMASNLTRDPKFTAALAAAISGRFVDQARRERW